MIYLMNDDCKHPLIILTEWAPPNDN
jgi:hypothetical protein